MDNGYRDLRVWQAGIDAVELVYRATAGFPPSEVYGLTAQLRRASVSIPSNIAEGHARQHLADYIYHLSVAQGSIAEVTTQLEIALRLGYLEIENASRLLEVLAALGRQVHKLQASLRSTQAGKGNAEIRVIPTPKTQHPTPARSR